MLFIFKATVNSRNVMNVPVVKAIPTGLKEQNMCVCIHIVHVYQYSSKHITNVENYKMQSSFIFTISRAKLGKIFFKYLES